MKNRHESPRADLADLNAFAAIATQRSFRKAAEELGLRPSTLSHTLRALEQRLGARLLHRTTRSVATTEVGDRLLARITPVLQELERALDEVDEIRGQPRGTLRINAGDLAIQVLLQAAIPEFRRRHPDVHLDLVSEGRLVDIVQEGFDAGVRLGESVPQDMIAIRFGREERCIVVGSAAYLAAHKAPASPDELAAHDCIRFRLPSGKLFRWEFEKRGQELKLDVSGPMTLDRVDLMLQAAANGVGLAYVFERVAEPYLASGRLVAVLGDWCPRFPGLHLYHPGHRHVPPALRAFIQVLKSIDADPPPLKAGAAAPGGGRATRRDR